MVAVVVAVVVVPERAKRFLPKFRQFQPIGYFFFRRWAFDPCYCACQAANSKGRIYFAQKMTSFLNCLRTKLKSTQ